MTKATTPRPRIVDVREAARASRHRRSGETDRLVRTFALARQLLYAIADSNDANQIHDLHLGLLAELDPDALALPRPW